jgi:hypothetical protein
LDVDMNRVVRSLAAAGHAPILFTLRPEVPSVPTTFGDRLVAQEVRRWPDWAIEWVTRRSAGGEATHDLDERLAAPRSPGPLDSDFIYPTMHLVDAGGLAAEVLDAPLRGMGVTEARRTLLRIAARSMLQDDPDAAPYGWTHCLTMPQAVLESVRLGADPDLAVAVAATYVLGFRATQGRVRLDHRWAPGRGTAAARVLKASEDATTGLVAELVAFGAEHPDAHVAKYTLACLHAAEADPEEARLYLAAAAHLHEWWATHTAAA